MSAQCLDVNMEENVIDWRRGTSILTQKVTESFNEAKVYKEEERRYGGE
jgi:hypothetical protein